jgi:hypothetical protein
MFYYKVLDLPHPPQEIIDSVDLSRHPEIMEIGIHNKRSLKNWYGKDFKASVNVRTKHAEFANWVKENITETFVDAGVNYVNITDGITPSSTGAHVDVIRKYTLLWNIQTGGPDATTCWWQENGFELERPPGTQVENLDDLTLVKQVIIPKGVWCLLYTQILHSVEKLVEPRVSFQVSLNDISTLIDKQIKN